MAGIRPSELPRMRHVQMVHLHDLMAHLVYSETVDGYNLPVGQWVVSAELPCGYNPASHDEVQGEGEVVDYDAVLRMPVTWQPDPRDRVRILAIHGDTLPTPNYALFDLVGVGERGPTAVLHLLKRVTDGGG